MGALGKVWWLANIAARLRLISKRTWLILAAVALVLLVLLAFIVIMLLFWLWAQIPWMIELAERLLSEVMALIERVAPK